MGERAGRNGPRAASSSWSFRALLGDTLARAATPGGVVPALAAELCRRSGAHQAVLGRLEGEGFAVCGAAPRDPPPGRVEDLGRRAARAGCPVRAGRDWGLGLPGEPPAALVLLDLPEEREQAAAEALAGLSPALGEVLRHGLAYADLERQATARLAELRDSEERFRGLFEDSPVCLWEEDFSAVREYLEGLRPEIRGDPAQWFRAHPEVVAECAGRVRVLDCNRESLALHRAATKQELLAGLPRTFTPRSLEGFQAQLVAILAGQTEVRTEGEVQTLDGERRYVDVCWRVARGSEATLDRVLVSLLDITQRRRAEERFQRLFDGAPSLYAITRADPGGPVIEDCNRLFAATLGYAPEELRGRPLAELFTPESAAALRDGGYQAALDGPVAGVERTLVARDGSPVPTLLQATPERDERGRVSGTLAIFTDLRAQKEAEAERARLEEQLRRAQKLQAVGTLVAGIAHEFNNLLMVILGEAELLGEALPAGELRAAAAEITATGQRAAGLTRQLLAFGRKQLIRPREVRLPELVTALAPVLRQVLGEAVAVRTVCDPAAPPVWVDPAQLEQVVMNFAVNAREAMAEGGELCLEVGTATLDAETAAASEVAGGPGTYATVTVGDTGVGVPPEIRGQIFEPFFTTKRRALHSGLGLSTVYGIAKQNRGHVELVEGDGPGAVFRLYLPAHLDAAGAPAGAGTPRPAAALGRGRTVLLAEDDAAVRRVLAGHLRDLGFAVVEADSAEAALARAAACTGPLCAVVTDVVMPGRSGPWLVAELGRTRPSLPALYVSGYPEDAGEVQGLAGPRAVLLAKPFGRAKLAAALERLLG